MITDKALEKFYEEHVSEVTPVSDYDRLMQERRDMFSKQILAGLICWRIKDLFIQYNFYWKE